MFVALLMLKSLMISHCSCNANCNLYPFLDREVAVILLGHEYWEDMLKTSLKIDDRKTTPMRELIAVMPGKLGLK